MATRSHRMKMTRLRNLHRKLTKERDSIVADEISILQIAKLTDELREIEQKILNELGMNG